MVQLTTACKFIAICNKVFSVNRFVTTCLQTCNNFCVFTRVNAMQCLSTLALSAFIGSAHQKFDNIEEHFVKAQMVEYTVYAMASTIRGRLHGAPWLNSALLTRLKIFAITWTISTPGVAPFTVLEHLEHRSGTI